MKYWKSLIHFVREKKNEKRRRRRKKEKKEEEEKKKKEERRRRKKEKKKKEEEEEEEEEEDEAAFRLIQFIHMHVSASTFVITQLEGGTSFQTAAILSLAIKTFQISYCLFSKQRPKFSMQEYFSQTWK